MSDNNTLFECLSCGLGKAARKYSDWRFEALARKAVFALQRISASGIYGDDCHHKTLWDEYCFEIQTGPRDQLEDAWQTTVSHILDDVVKAIPHEEAVLLSYAATWDLGEDDEHLNLDSVDPELIRRNLGQVLAKAAGHRDMSRFDPTA